MFDCITSVNQDQSFLGLFIFRDHHTQRSISVHCIQINNAVMGHMSYLLPS